MTVRVNPRVEGKTIPAAAKSDIIMCILIGGPNCAKGNKDTTEKHYRPSIMMGRLSGVIKNSTNGETVKRAQTAKEMLEAIPEIQWDSPLVIDTREHIFRETKTAVSKLTTALVFA